MALIIASRSGGCEKRSRGPATRLGAVRSLRSLVAGHPLPLSTRIPKKSEHGDTEHFKPRSLSFPKNKGAITSKTKKLLSSLLVSLSPLDWASLPVAFQS